MTKPQSHVVLDESPPPVAAPAEHSPSDGENMAELRSLLLGPTETQIAEIHGRLTDPLRQIEEVSRVLPEAVHARSRQDDEVTKALLPTVERAITISVRKDPQVLVDAIFPVMGPAIRRAIAAALSDDTALAFIATPNNPTGTALRTKELLALADATPPDCLLVVDAAYQEFVTGADAPDPIEPSGPVARVRFVNVITDTARGRVNASLEGQPLNINLTYTQSAPATLAAPSTAPYAAILAGERSLVLKRTADTSVVVRPPCSLRTEYCWRMFCGLASGKVIGPVL